MEEEERKNPQMLMENVTVPKQEDESTEDEEDRISELPDAVLHHILSYLTTEDAIRTGVLSKRWRYVWTLAPNLEFAYSHHPKFADFVNQSLLHYRGSRIQKFCLFVYIEQYCNMKQIGDAWSGFY